MKTKLIIPLALLTLLLLTTCAEEKLGDSIFDTSPPVRNEFDKWIYSNLVKPYNIEIKYRFDDFETELNYTLIPADEHKAHKIAQIIKLGWIDVYNSVSKPSFIRENAPKVIHFVGSPAYNPDGSEMLGTADSGIRITIFNVNGLKMPIDLNQISNDYFRILHHEFAHILHQKKAYDPDFVKISNGQYVKAQWINYPYNNPEYAYSKGFVSSYAMSFPDEDFAETFSIYLSYSDTHWQNLLEKAGESGSAIIINKLSVVESYFSKKWNIDIKQLKNTVEYNTNQLKTYQFEKLR